MDTSKPTRRAALGILATGPIAMLPALAVMQCSEKAEADCGSEISEAVNRYHATRAQYERFDAEVHMPALTARKEAVANVPHYVTRHQFKNIEGDLISLSTERPESLAQARATLERSGLNWEGTDWHATALELVKVADRRDAQIAALSRPFNLDGLRKREEELSAAVGDAISAVVFTPVASLAELVIKADFMTETDGWAIEDYQERFTADVRCLARLAQTEA